MYSFFIFKSVSRFPGHCLQSFTGSTVIQHKQVCVRRSDGRESADTWILGLISASVCVCEEQAACRSACPLLSLCLAALPRLNYCQNKCSLEVCTLSLSLSVAGANWGITQPDEQESKSAAVSRRARDRDTMAECVKRTASE